MPTQNILSGVVHEVPHDLENVLLANSSLLEKRNNLTPLARNEWICRVTIVKKDETRYEHLVRLQEDILGGKKRPCCRPGCPHRNNNAKKRFKNIPK